MAARGAREGLWLEYSNNFLIIIFLRSFVLNKRKTAFSRSRDQCAANWCTNFNCSLGLGFGDRLGLWLSSGNLLLSGDGLGLGFWLMVLES